MAIVTPNILPGEPGYLSKKERTQAKKVAEKKERIYQQKKEVTIGKIKPGRFRIGKPKTTPKGEKKFPIWRFSKQIGEITVNKEESTDEEVTVTFYRFGGIGNYKHLIQDADFRKQWMIREQELLITQKDCYVCKKKLSKNGQPNLYHYHLWKKRAALIEEAENIPPKIVQGKMTIEEAWAAYNDTLEEGNRYYMSLKETALVCATCAKQKNLQY